MNINTDDAKRLNTVDKVERPFDASNLNIHLTDDGTQKVKISK